MPMRLVFVFCMASTVSFAGTWFGRLVDSNCFESVRRNVNPRDTMTWVDRDTNSDIRYCAAKPKTKSFTLVEPSGESFRLNPEGNAKAAELLRGMARRGSSLYVTVTGKLAKNTVTVNSIVPAK
jgi:hypothetical protein